MNLTLYPSLNEVLELHKLLIKKFGGSEGVRDLGLLESSLMRPQTGYYDSLSLQAAALFQSLCQNHCFIDGNKRIAFATMAIFLRMNNVKIKVIAKDGEKFITKDIIQDSASVEIIAQWIEDNIEKDSAI